VSIFYVAVLGEGPDGRCGRPLCHLPDAQHGRVPLQHRPHAQLAHQGVATCHQSHPGTFSTSNLLVQVRACLCSDLLFLHIFVCHMHKVASCLQAYHGTSVARSSILLLCCNPFFFIQGIACHCVVLKVAFFYVRSSSCTRVFPVQCPVTFSMQKLVLSAVLRGRCDGASRD
jgi:hypothetical protein